MNASVMSDETVSGAVDAQFFVSRKTWSAQRPRVLVICCSDGRLQENIDEFLNAHLGIQHYDRLYLPGGPGALCSGGPHLLRADQLRLDCTFLLQAQQIEHAIFLWHGAACDDAPHDGPSNATCADYARKFPDFGVSHINARQQEDWLELKQTLLLGHSQIQLSAYRAEVLKSGYVRFIDLEKRD